MVVRLHAPVKLMSCVRKVTSGAMAWALPRGGSGSGPPGVRVPSIREPCLNPSDRPARARRGLERPDRTVPRCGAVTLGLLLVLGGCAMSRPVQPWEKGILAKPEMTFESDRLDTAFVEHVYSSKEAASGGSGVGGGGCGCN